MPHLFFRSVNVCKSSRDEAIVRILSYNGGMQALTHPNRADLTIESVFEALANPVRLRIVRRLASGEELTCSTVLPDVPASSATHHWRVLRNSGVLHARRQGRLILHTLRRDDLDARFPGLVDVIMQTLDPSDDSEQS